MDEAACQRASCGAAVYFFRDDNGRLLYVGEARNLQRRVLAHFAPVAPLPRAGEALDAGSGGG